MTPNHLSIKNTAAPSNKKVRTLSLVRTIINYKAQNVNDIGIYHRLPAIGISLFAASSALYHLHLIEFALKCHKLIKCTVLNAPSLGYYSYLISVPDS